MLFFAAEPPSVAKNQLARLVRAAAVFGFWGFFEVFFEMPRKGRRTYRPRGAGKVSWQRAQRRGGKEQNEEGEEIPMHPTR